MNTQKGLTRWVWIGGLLGLSLPGPTGGVALGQDETTRVSVDSGGGEANYYSSACAVSADGRYVAFASWASNLVPGDTNNKEDVFVHDRQTGVTTRVSVSSSGQQGNDNSGEYGVAISGDGRVVAFDSGASNLVSGDTNGERDIFVRDLETGVTSRVSVDSGGVQANGSSFSCSLSETGRYVAFDSLATGLTLEWDLNEASDVFVRDRQTATTMLISVRWNMAGTGSGESLSPSVSADGRFVAFASEAFDLVQGDTNETGDVFVRNLVMAVPIERVSLVSGGYGEADNWSSIPSISSDGRYVAFESAATNLAPNDVNGEIDVFVRDRQTLTTELASIHSSGSGGDGWSKDPSISADGRHVAFGSHATNLVDDDTNNAEDIFVRDRLAQTTVRASVDSAGGEANHISSGASISGDGAHVAFVSRASNLVPDDTNGVRDIFVRGPASTGSPCTWPTILVQPQTQTACIGSAVTFNVVAVGDQPLSYQWRKDGADIPGGVPGLRDVSNPLASYITIDPVVPDDVGVYDVVITNVCGSVTSAPATLSVCGNAGDFNGDGDVDLEDYAAFQLVFTGPLGGPDARYGP